jgi:hypothetical protein
MIVRQNTRETFQNSAHFEAIDAWMSRGENLLIGHGHLLEKVKIVRVGFPTLTKFL